MGGGAGEAGDGARLNVNLEDRGVGVLIGDKEDGAGVRRPDRPFGQAVEALQQVAAFAGREVHEPEGLVRRFVRGREAPTNRYDVAPVRAAGGIVVRGLVSGEHTRSARGGVYL